MKQSPLRRRGWHNLDGPEGRPSAHLSLGIPGACYQTMSRAGRTEFNGLVREMDLWLERLRALRIR
jgi:hypothetical protein